MIGISVRSVSRKLGGSRGGIRHRGFGYIVRFRGVRVAGLLRVFVFRWDQMFWGALGGLGSRRIGGCAGFQGGRGEG